MRVGLSIFLREDGRWEARYRKGRKADGTIIYGSVYGITRAEAEQKRIAVLNDLAKCEDPEENETRTMSVFATVNPSIRADVGTEVGNSALVLDDGTVAWFEKAVEGCSLAVRIVLSFSLYMGISFAEACVLKYSDVDLEDSRITVTRFLSDRTDHKNKEPTINMCTARTLQLLSPLKQLLSEINDILMRDVYIFTGTVERTESVRAAMNICRRELKDNGFNYKLIPESLQATFIRRALEYGINAETVAEQTGKEKNYIVKKFGKYIRRNPFLIEHMSERETDDQYSAFNRAVNDIINKERQTREMNLLIVGAGKYGREVCELAEKLGIFEKINFVDDKLEGDKVLGKISLCKELIFEYPMCFIAIDDNSLRHKLAGLVLDIGYIIPHLISPNATISKNVRIGSGSVIMSDANIGARAEIGSFAIISSECMIGADATVGDFASCDCASVIMRGAAVREAAKIGSGELVKAKIRVR